MKSLIDQLAAQGLTICITPDGKLDVAGPFDVLTDDLVTELAEYKPAIVAYLSERDLPSDGWTVRKNATHFIYEAPGCADYDSIDWDSPPTTKRLIGCGFPSRAPKQPPACILAAPVVICPSCNRSRVLPELTSMTGGLCWECHL